MPKLMAMVYDRIMAAEERNGLADWRETLLAGVSGDVLEIGGGTGANLEHYPSRLHTLTIIEPDEHMRAKLEPKLALHPELHASIEMCDAETMPFESGSFDHVVSTLVLCSVTDVEATLAEIMRVLRPGGTLIFIEHVAATARPKRLRWQERLAPAWKRLAGGCNLTRRTGPLIEAAGFEMEDCVVFDAPTTIGKLTATRIAGSARRPA